MQWLLINQFFSGSLMSLQGLIVWCLLDYQYYNIDSWIEGGRFCLRVLMCVSPKMPCKQRFSFWHGFSVFVKSSAWFVSRIVGLFMPTNYFVNALRHTRKKPLLTGYSRHFSPLSFPQVQFHLQPLLILSWHGSFKLAFTGPSWTGSTDLNSGVLETSKKWGWGGGGKEGCGAKVGTAPHVT